MYARAGRCRPRGTLSAGPPRSSAARGRTSSRLPTSPSASGAPRAPGSAMHIALFMDETATSPAHEANRVLAHDAHAPPRLRVWQSHVRRARRGARRAGAAVAGERRTPGADRRSTLPLNLRPGGRPAPCGTPPAPAPRARRRSNDARHDKTRAVPPCCDAPWSEPPPPPRRPRTAPIAPPVWRSPPHARRGRPARRPRTPPCAPLCAQGGVSLPSSAPLCAHRLWARSILPRKATERWALGASRVRRRRSSGRAGSRTPTS